MKNPILLSAGIALTLVSCTSDPEAAARKKSVSIGRFGVIHNTPVAVPADGAVAGAPVEGAPAADPNATVAQQQQAVPEPAKPEPVKSAGKESKPSGRNAAAPSNGDGIRLPSMLGLPEEKDLKATNPTVPKSNEGGAVISRPPTEKKD